MPIPHGFPISLTAGPRDDSPPPPPPPPARSPSLSPPPEEETQSPVAKDAAPAKPSPRKRTPKKPAVAAVNKGIAAAPASVPASTADAVAQALRVDRLESAVLGQDAASHASLLAGIRTELARLATCVPATSPANALADLEARMDVRINNATSAADVSLQEEMSVFAAQIATIKADSVRTMELLQGTSSAVEHAQLAASVDEVCALTLGNIDAVNRLGDCVSEAMSMLLRLSHPNGERNGEDRGRKRRCNESRSPSPRPPPCGHSSHPAPCGRSPAPAARARSDDEGHRNFGPSVIHSRARHNNNYGVKPGPSTHCPPPQRRSSSPAPPLPPAQKGQYCALFGKVRFMSRSRANPATIFTQVQHVIEMHPRKVELRGLPMECAWVKDSSFVTIHFATERARDDFISGWGSGCVGFERIRASRA
ncbi:hypothetical protein CPB85DRAFT_1443530 [Mucidula mucida]|nr:hypothetical protein CPB85DRAFT_1443530 [Mucidula mucida]